MLKYINSWVNPEMSPYGLNAKQKALLEDYTQFCKDAASVGITEWNFGGEWDYNWFIKTGYVKCFDKDENIVYCIPRTNNILFKL